MIITNAQILTCDSTFRQAQAVAVAEGVIIAVGSTVDIESLAASGTEKVDAGGRMVMPGLTDIHAHLLSGGTKMTWELTLQPTDGIDQIFGKVNAQARIVATNDWVVGGNIVSPVMDQLAAGGHLAALDAAAEGRPVLLRDDSHHNRWVNSRALEIMGVDRDTPDPRDGALVRDRSGRLTGVLQETACVLAERVAAASVKNPLERDRVAMQTAIQLMNSFGITAIQDAATLEPSLKALSHLRDEGRLTAWVVASLPARPFMIDGIVGEQLYSAAAAHRRDQVRPEFAKFFLDGVPMTRTSALTQPYVCHGTHEDPDDHGPLFWTDDELVEALDHCHRHGLGAKLHATGDRSVRQALDAIQVMRDRFGDAPIYHIAHVEYVTPADVPRFAELGVVADASPYIWFPTPIQASIDNQVPSAILDRSWPFRDLVDNEALLAAGSDWPIVPTPNPWNALQAFITRSNPDHGVGGQTNPAAAISLSEAISAFTVNSARAVGMAGSVGTVAPGRSADFAVLDTNLLDVATDSIHRTTVQQTYFRGRRVYGEDL